MPNNISNNVFNLKYCMHQKYHFISGLPRSGTTLLSSILNQNPKFYSEISGPLARFIRSIVIESDSQSGYKTICPVERRVKIMRGIFDSYYDGCGEVCFNTNRGWTGITPLLHELYPSSKIIICVRDIPWILDSFEQLLAKNPFVQTGLFSNAESTSIYTRCRTLLMEDRTVGFAYNCLKQGIFGNERSNLCVVEYNALSKNPKQTMQQIYTFIGEPYYDHNFNDVEYSNDEFDNDLNIKGLHYVRKRVQFIPRRSILPSDLWNDYQNLSFWKTNVRQTLQDVTWITDDN